MKRSLCKIGKRKARLTLKKGDGSAFQKKKESDDFPSFFGGSPNRKKIKVRDKIILLSF
jgi:hypothetical protein